MFLSSKVKTKVWKAVRQKKRGLRRQADKSNRQVWVHMVCALQGAISPSSVLLARFVLPLGCVLPLDSVGDLSGTRVSWVGWERAQGGGAAASDSIQLLWWWEEVSWQHPCLLISWVIGNFMQFSPKMGKVSFLPPGIDVTTPEIQFCSEREPLAKHAEG